MNMAKFLSVIEKDRYPFKSYPRGRCETILFPGCAFPSQFPKTMDVLSELCREHGAGIAYDCCGKPLEGFGEYKRAAKSLGRLRGRLDSHSCTRIITMCPNCLDYLGPKIGIEMVSVYQALGEWGVAAKGEFTPGLMFTPCPDRRFHMLENQIRSLYDLSAVKTMTHVPCCGLKPQVAARGPEAVQACSAKVIDKSEGQRIYTYCASCLGQFARSGAADCRHVLSVILGVDEDPDAAHAFMNRAKRKFDRDVNPIPAAV